jgi:hypothetical protein
MNSGDFKEITFSSISVSSGAVAPAASEKAPGFRTGEPLDSPHTPYRCQPPQSRKVAHYSKAKGKRKKAKEVYRFLFCLFPFAFCLTDSLFSVNQERVARLLDHGGAVGQLAAFGEDFDERGLGERALYERLGERVFDIFL